PTDGEVPGAIIVERNHLEWRLHPARPLSDQADDHGRAHAPSLGEEIANSVSHGVGLLGAVVAAPFLLAAARHGGAPAIVAVGGVGYPRLSTALYVAMGWLALVAIRPLWARIPVSGWLWLIAGGVAYTAGIAFYACDRRVRYGHFVWHLFVLLGTTCHVFAV